MQQIIRRGKIINNIFRDDNKTGIKKTHSIIIPKHIMLFLK